MARFIDEVSEAVDRASRLSQALLDVALVPEGHPLEKKLHEAWISLAEVLLEIPKAGSNGAAIFDPGPAVYVRPKRDPREWRTTSGGRAKDEVIPRSKKAQTVAEQEGPIAMPKWAKKRRILSSSEFIRALGSTKAPRNRTKRELAKVGVEIVDEHRLRCVTCGRVWTQPQVADGKKQKGYWKCSQGCNDF